MDKPSILTLLSLAFGLGLLHALDADHIMAVSGLAARRPSLRNSLRFCARWAVGHGLTLLLIGGAVLLLGMAIPERLSAAAETLVGVVLIVIGLWALWDLRRARAHLHFHDHDNLPPHAHWHGHNQYTTQHDADEHRHQHSAVFVGVLHGTAGSAPLLALIPLASLGHSPWLGMAYLALFSLGVLLAMFLFGGLLGSSFDWLSRRGNSALRLTRTIVAASSMIFGVYLLQSAFAAGTLA